MNEELKELKELRDKVANDKADEKDYMKIFDIFPPEEKKEEDSSEDKTNVMQFQKKNPNFPSLLDKDKVAGFSNIIYLATLSMVFEVLFIAISILIYK